VRQRLLEGPGPALAAAVALAIGDERQMVLEVGVGMESP